MFRRAQQFQVSLQALLDVAMVAAAFSLAYALRFVIEIRPLHLGVAPLAETVSLGAGALLVWPVVFSTQGLYDPTHSQTWLEEAWSLLKGTFAATLGLVGLTYFLRDVRYSRLMIGLFSGLSFVLIAAGRAGLRAVQRSRRQRGIGLMDLLVVGTGELAQQVIAALDAQNELGVRVVGLLARDAAQVGQRVAGVPVLGVADDLAAMLKAHPVQQVVIALPSSEQSGLRELMAELALHTVDVKVVPDLYQYITLCGGLEEFAGLPIISLQHGPLQGWNSVTKRIFDVVFASLAILVAGPVMLVTALLVKLTSKGPVLYAQERMGMDGKTFHILKFRSMRTDSEVAGAQMAAAVDPRRTPIGSFLRKTSIDELPQFFNVLAGNMSIVGPRPERPVFIEEFKKQIPKYHLRHKVKAGITGWAQINGLRGQTSIAKRIEYDLYYIEHWSLFLDFKILVRTALGGFLSKNAY
jgi:Undecaprenyl-phosphate glucose phosphotransferase